MDTDEHAIEYDEGQDDETSVQHDHGADVEHEDEGEQVGPHYNDNENDGEEGAVYDTDPALDTNDAEHDEGHAMETEGTLENTEEERKEEDKAVSAVIRPAPPSTDIGVGISLPTEEEVEEYMDDPCASTLRNTVVRREAETSRGKKHPFDTVDYKAPFEPKPMKDSSAGLQAFLRAENNWW